MNELRFNCPACGQAIQADPAYEGAQIQCPSCQAPMVVPGLGPEVAARPAVSTTLRPNLGMPRPKVPRLAKASLILSLCSVVLGPMGFIPGIICGHLARRRLRANRCLGGKRLVTAGLAVGYGFLALSVAMLAIVSTMVFRTAAQMQQQTKAALVPGAGPNGVLPAATMPKSFSGGEDAWKTNLTAISIPSTPVSGRIHMSSSNTCTATLAASNPAVRCPLAALSERDVPS